MSTPDLPYLSRLEAVEFAPIFIMGSARSGTSILYELLARTGCFNVVTVYHVLRYDELLRNHAEQRTHEAKRDLDEELTRLSIVDRKADHFRIGPDSPEEYGWLLQGRPGRIAPETLPRFIEICKKVQHVSDPARPLLLKNPDDFPHFAEVLRLLPRARLIFNHRHPLAVMSSWLKAARLSLDEPNPLGLLLSPWYRTAWKRPLRRHIIRFLLSDIAGLGFLAARRHVTRCADYFLEHLAEVPESHCTSVRYEDLCDRPNEIIGGVLDALGLSAAHPLDLAGRMRPRETGLLPVVAGNLDRLNDGLSRYCEAMGYPPPR